MGDWNGIISFRGFRELDRVLPVGLRLGFEDLVLDP